MNILQVIPYFVPAWDYGGPVRSCYELSKQLVDRGHKVTVYTTDALNIKKRNSVREEIIDGIKIKRFRNLSNYFAYKYNLLLSPGMITIGRRISNFDVVHMHEYRTIQNNFIKHYCEKYKIPYVLKAGGSLPNMMGKHLLKKFYDIFWGRSLLRNASKVIAVSEIEAEQYNKMGVTKNNIVVIPNGIDVSEFEVLPEKGQFRRKYNLSSKDKIILYLGRIHKIKGIDILVKAFAGISKYIDDTKLVIAGPDNGYLSTLKDMIEELDIQNSVILTGPLYERLKIEAYVDSDVYVLPSAYEVFGNTILEALACGTPVIATDRCHITDSISDQIVFTFSYDNDDLLTALIDVLVNSKKATGFSEDSKLLVKNKYDWRDLAIQLEELYQRVIA